MNESIQLAMEDVARAHRIGVLVGAVVLFIATLTVLGVARHVHRATRFKVLSFVVCGIGLVLAYLAYGHVASAVEESLLMQFVESGFICVLPGITAKLIVPVVTASVAGLVHRILYRRLHAV